MTRIPDSALRALTKFVEYSIKSDELNSSITKNRLDTMAKLYQDHAYILWIQAGMHAATAGIGGTAGVLAPRVNFDVASAVSLATKCGEGATTMERGKEKGIEGELAAVNHKVSKGSEANKRTGEILQQLVQNVRTACDLHARHNSPAA